MRHASLVESMSCWHLPPSRDESLTRQWARTHLPCKPSQGEGQWQADAHHSGDIRGREEEANRRVSSGLENKEKRDHKLARAVLVIFDNRNGIIGPTLCICSPKKSNRIPASLFFRPRLPRVQRELNTGNVAPHELTCFLGHRSQSHRRTQVVTHAS